MKIRSTTYKGFLDSIHPASKHQLEENAESIIEHFQPAKQLSSRFAPITFLLDYSTKKYIYVSESCFDMFGYTANYFLEMGLEDYLSRWHEADFSVINKTVFIDSMAFLKTLHPNNYNDYIFSYNYRIRNPIGNYVTILQRFSYIPGSSISAPAGMIGVAFDITHYKTDTSIVHTIEKALTYERKIVNELVFKKVHPVYETGRNQFLSKRETEILRYVAQGMGSKQIADKMSLSINTINNHRRNMLAKIGCKSSSELINYGIKHGLI
jgi:DNA-binding CsgD family transcriptional regulator